MKNKTFISSIVCAIKGIIYAIKTEKNYKYYTAILIAVTIINVIAKVEYIGYIAEIITAAGVYSAECLNTSIEHTINMVSTEIRDDIRIIKDIAASSVLCWGIAFFACEIIMIGKAII